MDSNTNTLHQESAGGQTVLSDLTAARRYLRELSGACKEGAEACDPRVTALALGLVAHAGRELTQ